MEISGYKRIMKKITWSNIWMLVAILAYLGIFFEAEDSKDKLLWFMVSTNCVIIALLEKKNEK